MAAGDGSTATGTVEAPSPFAQALWCTYFGAGIISMLVVYGLLQERIMTLEYDGKLFKFSVFLIFCNRVANVIFATVMVAVNKESILNKAPLWKYLIISLSNVFASACQYEALKYVSFAVQMLGKSFKMMPVMLWGMAISGKQYSLMDWTIAAFVTGGVTQFLMTGPTASPTDDSNSMRGFLFLMGFLALDGLTSTMQEKLFKEHKTSKFNQMFYVNLISSIVSLVTLISSGALIPSLSFCGAHRDFVVDAFVLSASASASQYFIYSQVKEFGALVFAATMNVRQVVSIIVSYITYHHSVTFLQVVGLAFVFGALFYKSFRGLAASPTKAEKALLLQKAADVESNRANAADYSGMNPKA